MCSSDLDAEGRLEGSHYLHALSALLERVAATLRVRGTRPHRVDIHAARLALDHAVLAAGRRAFIVRPADIGRAAGEALRALPDEPTTGPGGATVRFVSDIPAAFDALVHPGIVIADFLSNALWRFLCAAPATRTWSEFAHCLQPPVGSSASAEVLPALGFEGSLRGDALPTQFAPMVAVTGQPAEFVRAVWRGERAPDAAFDAPAVWAQEQARRWAKLTLTERA